MSGFLTLLRREPVRVFNLIKVALVVAVAFGLKLTAEQTAAIVAGAAVIFGGGAEIVRSTVSPTEKLGDAWEPPLP